MIKSKMDSVAINFATSTSKSIFNADVDENDKLSVHVKLIPNSLGFGALGIPVLRP